MKFKQKFMEFRAFQVTPESRLNQAAYPEWLQDAFEVDRESIGSVYLSNAHDVNSQFNMTNRDGDWTIMDSDWILINDADELHAIDNEFFLSHFEAA